MEVTSTPNLALSEGCFDDTIYLAGSLTTMHTWEAQPLEHSTICMGCECGMPCASTHSNRIAPDKRFNNKVEI